MRRPPAKQSHLLQQRRISGASGRGRVKRSAPPAKVDQLLQSNTDFSLANDFLKSRKATRRAAGGCVAGLQRNASPIGPKAAEMRHAAGGHSPSLERNASPMVPRATEMWRAAGGHSAGLQWNASPFGPKAAEMRHAAGGHSTGLRRNASPMVPRATEMRPVASHRMQLFKIIG
ncbi:hypothetical protein DQX05_21685 [Paenibacillus thiaminolyticus]|uniref:Uncharacterized protein n=1 Tax=Paenibacillus thiaminolyticus TaxID=49283 RepID=A0A3A3GYM5_PANTH|nr:hypothetical protein DQX05_21685 [Paenibacillus thiaminolyticus]